MKSFKQIKEKHSRQLLERLGGYQFCRRCKRSLLAPAPVIAKSGWVITIDGIVSSSSTHWKNEGFCGMHCFMKDRNKRRTRQSKEERSKNQRKWL